MDKNYSYPDTAQLQLRKVLSGLSDDDAKLLARLAPLFEPQIPRIIDGFYNYLQQHTPLRAIIAEHTTIDRLKSTFRLYCQELFSGNYDDAYMKKRIRVGLAHVRVGLPLVWYQGLHLYLRECIITEIDRILLDRENEIDLLLVRRAVDRLMSLDQLLTSDSYVVRFAADLEEQTRRAHAATLAKTTFMAAASHELRTPLSAIVGFADLLTANKDEMSAKTQKYLNAVARNAKNLLAMINQLLDLSRIQSGKWDVEIESVDLAAILSGIATDSQPMLAGKAVIISSNWRSLEGGIFRIDRQKVRQIVSNLVQNAAKFTESGTIEIGAKHEGNTLTLWVKDTGPGMNDAQLAEIFEEFRQLKTAGSAGGVGLGLAICRDLVRLLGGDISVTSTVGAGSLFTVVLPAIRVS